MPHIGYPCYIDMATILSVENFNAASALGISPMRNLLFIDDDAVVRKLGVWAFEKIGQFKVMQASSGEMALEQLDSFIPDVVILDVMMPGMDGPATLLKIRAKHPNLPVIFLTGQTEPSQVKMLKSLKPNGLIAKPFDHKTIAKVVHGILDALAPPAPPA